MIARCLRQFDNFRVLMSSNVHIVEIHFYQTGQDPHPVLPMICLECHGTEVVLSHCSFYRCHTSTLCSLGHAGLKRHISASFLHFISSSVSPVVLGICALSLKGIASLELFKTSTSGATVPL